MVFMYKGIIFCSFILWMMFNGLNNFMDDFYCIDELVCLILCLLIVGVVLLGNFLVVLFIWVRDKFWIFIYVVIFCLVVFDLLVVIFWLVCVLICRICVLYYDIWICFLGKYIFYDKFGVIVSIFFFILIYSLFCYFVFFLVIRYIIVVYLMFVYCYLISGKVLRYFGLVWIVMFVISFVYVYCCV